MAIICRQYGLLFIMTPRTACTAVGDLLCTHYGGEFIPAEDILDSLYFKQKLKYQPLLADPSSWVNRSIGYAGRMHYAQTHSFNEWVFNVSYRKLIKRFLTLRASMFADYTS